MHGNTDEATVSAVFGKLTKRQSSVLALMLEGLPNKEIAQRLHLAEETVKGHVSAILERLGARTRRQVMSQLQNFCVRPPSLTQLDG